MLIRKFVFLFEGLVFFGILQTQLWCLQSQGIVTLPLISQWARSPAGPDGSFFKNSQRGLAILWQVMYYTKRLINHLVKWNTINYPKPFQH